MQREAQATVEKLFLKRTPSAPGFLKWKTGQKENISNISQLPVPGGCHHDTASGHIRIMTPFCWNNIMLIHPPGEFLPASILGGLYVRISLAVVALLSMFLLFDWQ